MAIILFHCFPEKFPMGYLGVDVFLVISGYLLFLKPIDFGKGSLFSVCSGFLRKKAVRTMIPLAAAVPVALVAALYAVPPEDAVFSAQTALSALCSVANVQLTFACSNYFAADTSYNVCVPFWYLSAICQIYLMFLSGSVLLRKVRGKWLVLILGVVAALSFICSPAAYVLHTLFPEFHGNVLRHFSLGYYSSVGRMWEILLGGAVAFLPEGRCKWLHEALCPLCLAAVVFFMVSGGQAGKNIMMLLTVPLTCECLLARNSWCAHKVLSRRGAVLVGAVSFSLYLIHMPVFFLLRECGWYVALAGVAVAGALFHILIERRRFRTGVAWGMWGGSLALAGAVWAANPSETLWSPLVVESSREAPWVPQEPAVYGEGYDFDLMPSWETKSTDIRTNVVRIGDEAAPASFILVGDSHARCIFDGISLLCEENGLGGLYLATYITPIYGYNINCPDNISCNEAKLDALLHWLEVHPEIKTVILGQRWYLRSLDKTHHKWFADQEGDPVELAEQGLRRFLQGVQALERQVVVINQIPHVESKKPSRNYLLAVDRGRTGLLADIRCSEADFRQEMGPIFTVLDKLESEGLCRILHVEEPLFRNGTFQAVEDGKVYLKDNNHMSPYAAEYVIRSCSATLLEWLGAASHPSHMGRHD